MRHNTWYSLMWVCPEINLNIQLHRMRVKGSSESYLVVGDVSCCKCYSAAEVLAAEFEKYDEDLL